MGKIVKKIKKLIPKEIKPALPYIAAFYGGPMLASKFAMNPMFAKGITAAITSKATGGDTKDALRAGILSVAPDIAAKGMTGAGRYLGNISPESKLAQTLVSKGTGLEATLAKPSIDLAAAKVIGGQATLEAGAQAAKLNEQALRDYEAQLREQGIMDSADRRNKIFGYFSGALNTKTGDRLYSDDEINSFLDKYGYAYGGRVGYKNGRRVSGRVSPFQLTPPDKISQFDLTEGFNRFNKKTAKNDDDGDDELTREEIASYLKEAIGEDDESKTYKRLGSLQSGLEGLMSGYELATGRPLMGSKPQPTRFGLQEGGIPMTQNARKTIKELIESGMLEDEGEGILDLIRKNPRALGEPMKPIKPLMENKPLSPMQMSVTDSNPDTLEEFAIRLLGRPLDQLSPEQKDFLMEEIDKLNSRYGYAEGGMMNLGGREMDMRGGGFIPIGAKERADDVPARLSKNEFVMTADAVRAAGGGSINKGAKRMYDLMNKLESKV